MRDGRVSVNGRVVVDLGTKADPERDEIRVDGRRIKARERARYLLLNKPRGYVTTRSDPQRRPTVIELLGGVREYVYPVGRLDFDSEGLLLLTNDGELAARLTHPRHEVARVYEARVRGVPDARTVERLERGVVIDDRRTAPATVRVVRDVHEGRHDQTVIEVTIREGRNRQVRKMCEAVGHPVFALRRTRIGPIADPRLPVGAWRDLTPREVAALQRVAGSLEAAHEAPAETGSAPPASTSSAHPRRRAEEGAELPAGGGSAVRKKGSAGHPPRGSGTRPAVEGSATRRAPKHHGAAGRQQRADAHARPEARGTDREREAAHQRPLRRSRDQAKHGRGAQAVRKKAHERKVR